MFYVFCLDQDTAQASPPPPYPTEQLEPQQQQQTASVKPYPVQTEADTLPQYSSSDTSNSPPQQTQPNKQPVAFTSVVSKTSMLHNCEGFDTVALFSRSGQLNNLLSRSHKGTQTLTSISYQSPSQTLSCAAYYLEPLQFITPKRLVLIAIKN